MKKKLKYDTIENILYIFSEVWKLDKPLIFILLLDGIVSGLNVFPMMFLPKLVLDEITEGKNLLSITGNILLIISVHFFLSFIRRHTNTRAFYRCIAVRMDFILKYGEKSMAMDFEHLENSDVLDIASRAQKCMWNPQMGLQGMIHCVQDLVSKIVIFVGCIFIISSISIWMIFIIMILACINFFIRRQSNIKQKRLWDKIDFLLRKLNYINELMRRFSIGKDIRIFNMSVWIKDKYMQALNYQYEGIKKIYNTDFKFEQGLTATGLIEQVTLYLFIVIEVFTKAITVGNFSLYLSTASTFSGNVDSIFNILADMSRKNAEICDYREFLEYPDIITADEPIAMAIEESGKYTVEFKNVSFKYPYKSEYALRNINLKIEPGQKLAIVGFNGAGKSTFIKLLCRLYTPTEGEILINGININNFSKSDYFKMFSVIFQDIYAFAFSIFENISMDNYSRTDANECIKVAKMAGLYKKIELLPNKFNTTMLRVIDDDGLELSGGETQKLALARALYKKAPFIILDEPTSALDALAERDLYEHFDDLSDGKSAVYISHRLASTKFCDKIAVFDNGEIVQYGSHAELFKIDGSYKKMFELQSQYYMTNDMTLSDKMEVIA